MSADLELVARAKNGDREAFGELITRYHPRCLRTARRITRNRALAEDVCQDAYLKAMRFVPKFAGDCAFSTWLHRIVLHKSFDALVARRRRPECPILTIDRDGEEYSLVAAVHDQQPLPDARYIAGEHEERIRSMLHNLTGHERNVFMLRHVDCLTHREIAARLGTSEGAAKVALCHATRKLRRAVETIQAAA